MSKHEVLSMKMSSPDTQQYEKHDKYAQQGDDE